MRIYMCWVEESVESLAWAGNEVRDTTCMAN